MQIYNNIINKGSHRNMRDVKEELANQSQSRNTPGKELEKAGSSLRTPETMEFRD